MIKQLILATTNKDKIKEIKKLLAGINLRVDTVYDIKNSSELIQKLKNAEKYKTLWQNALAKSKLIAQYTYLPALAEDTGLFVDALKGEPGIYCSKFAGENPTYDDNINKLLTEMKDIPLDKRKATFKSISVLVIPNNNKVYIESGVCHGIISTKKLGKLGFGYDPVFIPRGYNKTFAQLGLKIKNKISHRAKSIKKIKKIIHAINYKNLLKL